MTVRRIFSCVPAAMPGKQWQLRQHPLSFRRNSRSIQRRYSCLPHLYRPTIFYLQREYNTPYKLCQYNFLYKSNIISCISHFSRVFFQILSVTLQTIQRKIIEQRTSACYNIKNGGTRYKHVPIPNWPRPKNFCKTSTAYNLHPYRIFLSACRQQNSSRTRI